MEITVTWKAKPASGQTDIDVKDLGLTQAKWEKMNKNEQAAAVNEWLKNNEETIVPMATEWTWGDDD